MKEDTPVRADDRWQYLVNAAFRLDEEGAQRGEALDATIRLLDGALEVFTSQIDPLEDFEGYAVRRLLLALRERLVDQSSGVGPGPSHPAFPGAP